MIEARIIADSVNPFGNRITSYVLTFPRIVLAEFNTHRALSRNSASSRAIPSKKMLKMVQENPFIPTKWMKEHTGMQGSEYFKNTEGMPPQFRNFTPFEFLEGNWLKARNEAIHQAKILNEFGLSKQICNRLLEPFMWHTVIATATEWENFYALRAHPDAEIHIQELAYKMLEAANASSPKKLLPYEWHIPFGDTFDEDRILQEALKEAQKDTQRVLAFEARPEYISEYEKTLCKLRIATARCARVSYLNFEGKDDYETDIALYNRLRKSKHFSPFEHCAFANNNSNFIGNFKGWTQLRKTLEGENATDSRLLRK